MQLLIDCFKETLTPLILFALCISFLIGCQPPKSEVVLSNEVSFARDELSIQHGLELFNQHCASCHSFEEDVIGPNLSGVTSNTDKQWLASFISNAPSMIESGDERAVQLDQKYQQSMPVFSMLEDEQIEHIMAFLHRFSEGEKKKQNNRPGGLINPVTTKIPMSDLTLVLEELLIVPASADDPPLARINKLLSIESNQVQRLFIHDLMGKLYEINDGATKVFLDLAKEQPNFIDNPGWGTGFGSFAFHPEFEENGLFYTTHTEPKRIAPADFALNDSIPTTLQWVLTEWKSDDPLADKYAGAHRELLRADMYSGAHGFQELTINPLAKPGHPDYGLLYLGVGDGSLALRGYPHLCNDPGEIWGSVLRIDPAGNNSVNGMYGIPEDNPFVNHTDALGEVWALGFRNPHRISWDLTGSGKMFISNIGQHSLEEVNLGVAGAHYGWPDREGTFLYDVMANPELVYPLPAEDSGYVYPVAQYDHDEGNAISGGFVYAGNKIPLLQGKYIFGDIPRGKLFYTEVDEMELGQMAQIHEMNMEINGQKTDLETVTNNKRVNLRFGTDHSGELYIFTKSNGALYRVIDCKEPTAM